MATPLSVLILEDRPSDAELLLWELRRAGFEPNATVVDNERGFVVALASEPDIILTDFNLPQFDALGALSHLREHNVDIPVIVVTGILSDESAVVCIKAGAADYLIKDRLARLGGAVTQALEQRRLRREAQESAALVARSQQQLDAVFQQSPNALLVVDDEGAVVDVNDAASELTGLPPGEMVGRRLPGLLAASEWTDDAWAAFLAEGERTVEGRLTGPAGEREVEYRARAGIVPGRHLLVIHDLTERNRQAALREETERAKAANLAKTEFLSRMSHELRTPLNVILGFAQILQLEPLGDEQEESVDHILKAGRHLLNLIEEVLDLSRVESNHLSLSIEPILVEEVVTEVLGLVRPLANDRQITLVQASQHRDGFVRADRQRLKQVMLNLLSNAIKYNRHGGTVTVSCAPSGAGTFRIEVMDTGLGIQPDRMVDLFQPFQRLGAEMTPVEGTGLGLALCQRLVQAMDGEIGATSELGVGSTFWVKLPLEAEPGRGQPAEVPPAASASPTAPSHEGLVLYIEDNLANLALVEKILARRQGVRLIPAMQGRLGLELAREHQPDLILLDLHLSDMTGQALLQELQADPATRRIPVIVASADVTPGTVNRLLAGGATGFLSKPFDIREFMAKLDEILS